MNFPINNKNYNDYLFEKNLSITRKILLLSIVLYSAFGIVDYFLEVDNLYIFFIIRYAIMVPAVIIVLLISYHKIFKVINYYLISSLYVLGGLGIVAMIIADPSNFSYYGGLFLIFSVGYFILKIPWQFAALGSLLIIIMFVGLTLIYLNEFTIDSLVYLLLYISFNILAIFGSYNYSKVTYKNYIHEMNLIGDKFNLEKKIDEYGVNLETSNYALIYSLAKLAESKDHFTGNHLDRVGDLSLRLANEIDKSIYTKNDINKEEFLQAIEHASKLHDIGKIGVSESILMKSGIYTLEERKIMQEHCNIGSSTLYQIKKQYPRNIFVNMGIKIAHSHHENWDGSGYPDGLTGRTIPFSARLVSVIDVYDALTNERPYKKAFTHDEALKEIASLSGTKFDKDIIDVFLKVCKAKSN